MWMVAGLGSIGCLFGLVLGFFPPNGISHWPTPVYVLVMLVAIIICSVPPFLADILKKPSWKITHPDPVLLDMDPDVDINSAPDPVPG